MHEIPSGSLQAQMERSTGQRPHPSRNLLQKSIDTQATG